MRINKLTDYGIVVMTRIAAMENDKSHTAKEISTLSKIPLPTVTRLLKTLSNEGLLNSQRGSQGGYSLAQSPATISVASIIEAFEGPIALTDCAKEDDCGCSYESNCSAEEPWQKINEIVKDSLENIKLSSMIKTKKDDGFVKLNMNMGAKV